MLLLRCSDASIVSFCMSAGTSEDKRDSDGSPWLVVWR
jgi:hypothetical protein